MVTYKQFRYYEQHVFFFLVCMQLQFRRTPVAADVDIEALVAQTTGFSGAEVGMQPTMLQIQNV